MDFLKRTKKECIDAGIQAAQLKIEAADTDMLKEYLSVKSQLEYLTAYGDTIKKAAIEEYETYGEKEVAMYGRRISVVEAGVKLDYSKCGHPHIQKYSESMAKEKANLDDVKKFIKGLNRSEKIKIRGQKELVTVRPPIKTSTTTIKINY